MLNVPSSTRIGQYTLCCARILSCFVFCHDLGFEAKGWVVYVVTSVEYPHVVVELVDG